MFYFFCEPRLELGSAETARNSMGKILRWNLIHACVKTAASFLGMILTFYAFFSHNATWGNAQILAIAFTALTTGFSLSELLYNKQKVLKAIREKLDANDNDLMDEKCQSYLDEIIKKEMIR